MTDVMFANVAGGRHGTVRGSPAIEDDTSVVFTPPPPYTRFLNLKSFTSKKAKM